MKSLSRPVAKGSALVIVLSCVVLVAVLVISFLSSVSSDLQSSKVYSSGSAVKLLAQSAVNLVIGQIRVATADPTLDWASQPGMIRTYGTTGAASGYYKLYSDDTMQGTGAFNQTLASNTVPTDWYSRKGIYIDLNRPVSVNSKNFYPILDGDAADMTMYTPSTDVGSVKTLGSSNTPSVSGFWLTGNTPVDSTSPNQVPMPVKWLYQLQGGQIIEPDTTLSSSGSVTFANAGIQPSKTNPIVGRIAFWTDDESAKVNVNTASEGTPWATPHTYTNQDVALAQYQPFQNEYQRYPGHPAMVSFSGVFPALTPANDSSYPEDLYPVTPRTMQGGSKEGTKQADTTSSALTLRSDRLYTSLDDFLLQPGLSSSGTRLLNSANASSPSSPLVTALSPATLQKSRFFLTAYSVAPDVNVFNLPRVCMWPITLDKVTAAPKMTPFDQLIAFCETANTSTSNPSTYYFQRQDPTSQTADLPYPISATGSATGLARNRQLMEYLRGLMSKPFPGFSSASSATFASKYPLDYNQILVEMFDYIRSTNVLDGSTETAGSTPTGTYYYAPSLATGTTSSSVNYEGGTAQVVPIIDLGATMSDGSNPRGFGRFPTVHSATLHFIGCGDVNSVDSSNKPLTPAITGTNERLQAAFYLQMFDPSQGCPLVHPWYRVVVSGLDGLKWNGYSMGFPATATLPIPTSNGATGNGAQFTYYGGIIDYRQFFLGQAQNAYPCVSKLTGQAGSVNGPDIPQGTFTFSGGTNNSTTGAIKVQIYALDANSNQSSSPIQTLTFNFPDGTFPVPTTNNSPVNTASPPVAVPTDDLRGFYSTPGGTKGRLAYPYNYYPISLSNDVARSVIATPGDMRLIAPRSTVPASSYAVLTAPAGAAYATPANPFSYMLRFGRACPAPGAAGGVLVYGGATSTYSHAYPQYNSTYETIATGLSDYNHQGTESLDSDVPNQGKDITIASNVQGDWDTGIADLRDGSYINKADEGDIGATSGSNTFPYFDLDYTPSPTPPSSTLFSPNRMIPSAAMFGSLPTGVWSNSPWQTLLFRPGPALHPGLGTQTGTATYPGSAPYSTLPDHLLLDLFHMPVVEPYAISKPFATAGRINMNYSIVPFTYINRDTGLRAAMKAQTMSAINVSHISNYKSYQNPASPTTGNYPASVTTHFSINPDATLSQFRARFGTGDIFRSASEICSIDLVPADTTTPAPTSPTRANMDAYWSTNKLTGDNLRERPYADLYPLLTTKSNVYSVYYEVQALKQTPNADSTYATWVESKDVVLGTYRGAQTIERYIDPTDNIPDYATATSSTQPLSQFYRFRTLSNRQFAP